MTQGCPSCPPELRCTCDLSVRFMDPFDPDNPNPPPLAIEGCPAHRARRAYQTWAVANHDDDS